VQGGSLFVSPLLVTRIDAATEGTAQASIGLLIGLDVAPSLAE
jgi:hypothetical protein